MLLLCHYHMLCNVLDVFFFLKNIDKGLELCVSVMHSPVTLPRKGIEDIYGHFFPQMSLPQQSL